MRRELGLKILKIGGSVITEKRRDVLDSARTDRIKEICEVIARNPDDLILIHGAGSFGHPYVERYRLEERRDIFGISVTHLACKRLNEMICKTLSDYGVAVLPIHPLLFFKRDIELKCDLEFLKSIVDEGFLPVLHGDMVYNSKERRFEVLSGDEITVFLAEKLDVERIGFATDVDGIIYNGKVLDVFDKSMLNSVGFASGKSDVTGGMRGKLERIFNSKIRCEVFVFKGSAENVEKFLRGEEIGTKVIV